MKDIFILQNNYRCKYLVVIDADVYVYKYDKNKFDHPFLSFKPKRILLVNQKFVL